MTTPFPFVAAQVLTAQELNSITNLPSSTKTVSYVLVAGDAGKRIVMNAAGSTTITVNTSLFSAGDVVELSNINTGVCTLTAGTATVSSAGPLAIPQYGGGRLVFTSASAAIYYPSAVTVAPPAAAGLTFVGGGSLSGTSTTFSSVFSATYNAYRILLINMTNTASPVVKLQLGSTNTGYEQTQMYCNNTTAWTFNSSATTFFELGQTNSTDQTSAVIDLVAPFLSAQTFISSMSAGYGTQRDMTIGLQDSSTSFTAFTIFNTQSSSMSGTVQVFGYANS